MSLDTINTPCGSPCGWARLLAAVLTIGVIWGAVFPWIASQPNIQRQLTFLEERGIDPSAMFYTELDAMDPILAKLEQTGDGIVATKKPAE